MSRILRAEFALLLGAAVVYGFLCLSLLLRVPPVHFDEAGYAQASLSLARNGTMASPGFAPFEPSFATHTFWMPPAYFLAVAGVFKVAGFGIVQLRLFSVIMGLVAIAFLFLALRRIHASWLLPGTALALLVTDPTFLEQARTGRMEAMTMAAVAAGAYCYLRGLRSGETSWRWPGAAGTFAAIAWLTHPLGVALLTAIVVSEAIRGLKSSGVPRLRLGALVAPSVVGGVGWFIYIAQDPTSFRAQMGLQSGKLPLDVFQRVGDLLSHYHPELAAVYAAYFSLACLALILAVRRPDSSVRFLSLLFLGGCVAAIYGSDPWYLGYLPFYGVGSLVLVARNLSLSARWSALAGAVVVGLLLFNISSDFYLFQKYRVTLAAKADYLQLARQVDELIPENQKVLLATSNTPYFVMAQHRDPFDLVMTAGGSVEALRRVLNQSDYVVVDFRSGVSLLPDVYQPATLEFVEARGELVGQVGYECGGCISFKIWKVAPQDPATKPDASKGVW